MADVAVVGGGVGGMAAALRLRVAGHDVVLFERHDVLGGKLGARRVGGYTFDTGPSLLTLPHVFDDLFRLAGSSLAEAVEPVRLDPICRYRWPDGTAWDHAAKAPPELVAFLDHGRRVWEVAERTFFAGPMESPLALARRMRSPRDLLAIDALRSLHSLASRTFEDPHLVQWADRYATYSGSSPWKAPATLSCIPWIEQRYGAWHLRGGLATLAIALGDALVRLGVDVRTGCDVAAVIADSTAVRGVRLAGGERVDAGVVVANVDAVHLYADLLPDDRRLRRTLRAPRSSSGFALLLGLAGRSDRAHHNVDFSADYAAENTGGLADDPTVYVANPAATDPSMAPDGHESWFVLLNVPAGCDADWDAVRDRVVERLGVAERVRVCETITPADLAARFRSWQGSIYGTSSDGRRAAFLRPGNRGPREGLFLVGGASHPGGGLPLVALSGKIVADMIGQ